MIDLDAKMKVFVIAVETFVLNRFKIIINNIHTIGLLWTIILSSNIKYLVIIIFLLVDYLVDIIFEDKYP